MMHVDTDSSLAGQLDIYLKKEKPFLQSSISIDDLSKALCTNRTYLSTAIRENYHTNFSGLINELRIREARIMLADPKYHHISIEGIGQMVGFNSKSSFHKYFKDYVGITPSFFRDKIIS